MRARTEDLLTLRDGEPIAADLRERLLSDPDNTREIERLARVADELGRLPRLEPPAGVWAHIAAEAQPLRRLPGLRAAGLAGAAIAAATLLAALLVSPWQTDPPRPAVSAPPSASTGSETTAAGNDSPPEPSPLARVGAAPPAAEIAPLERGGLERAYAPLVAESARLERVLVELERRPRRASVGTAITIADLEDHLVLLDEQLTFAEARDADARYRQALWRERVDVMNALVHLRYAQYWTPRAEHRGEQEEPARRRSAR